MNINVSMPTKHQLAVVGSHIVVGAGAAIAAVAFFGGLNPAQVHEAIQDVSRISADVTDLVGAVSSLAALAMMAFSAIRSGPFASFIRSASYIADSPKMIAQLQQATPGQKADVVAITDKLPEVAGVAIANTGAGMALAAAVPSSTVQVAKT